MQMPFSREWARIRKVRSQCVILEGLSDRQLRDIGIKRRNILNISRKVTGDS